MKQVCLLLLFFLPAGKIFAQYLFVAEAKTNRSVEILEDRLLYVYLKDGTVLKSRRVYAFDSLHIYFKNDTVRLAEISILSIGAARRTKSRILGIGFLASLTGAGICLLNGVPESSFVLLTALFYTPVALVGLTFRSPFYLEKNARFFWVNDKAPDPESAPDPKKYAGKKRRGYRFEK